MTPDEEIVTKDDYQLPELINISGSSTESGTSNWSNGKITSIVPLAGTSLVTLKVKAYVEISATLVDDTASDWSVSTFG